LSAEWALKQQDWADRRPCSFTDAPLLARLQPARQRSCNDDGLGGVLAVELDLANAGAPPLDLFRRNENLPHVLVGLAEMLLQFQHALVQAFEVVHEVADLGMNLVGSLTHARIFLDLLNDLDREHQQRW